MHLPTYSLVSGVLRVAVRGPLLSNVRQGEEQGFGSRSGDVGVAISGIRQRVSRARERPAAARCARDRRQRHPDPARAWGQLRGGRQLGCGACDAPRGSEGQGWDCGCPRATRQRQGGPDGLHCMACCRDPGVRGGERSPPPRHWGVWSWVREEGGRQDLAKRGGPGARAHGSCGCSSHRRPGGGDRRGHSLGRCGGLEDFGQERPKVQHSHLHAWILERPTSPLPESPDHAELGCSAPCTGTRTPWPRILGSGHWGQGAPRGALRARALSTAQLRAELCPVALRKGCSGSQGNP